MFWLLVLILAATSAIFCIKKKPKAQATVIQKPGVPKSQPGPVVTSVTPSPAGTEVTKTGPNPKKKDDSLKFKTLTSSAESLKTDLRSLDDGPNPLMDAEIRDKLMKRLEKKNKNDAGAAELGKSQEGAKTPREQTRKPSNKGRDSDDRVNGKSDMTQPDVTHVMMQVDKTTTLATQSLMPNVTQSVMPTAATAAPMSVLQIPSAKKAKKPEGNGAVEGTGNLKQQSKSKKNRSQGKQGKPTGAVKVEEMTQTSPLPSQLEVESTMSSRSDEADKKKRAEKNNRK